MWRSHDFRFSACLIMVYGIWYMVYGIWYMVYGIWYMVYGIWYMDDASAVCFLTNLNHAPTALDFSQIGGWNISMKRRSFPNAESGLDPPLFFFFQIDQRRVILYYHN